jgi:hypothetical protein
MEDVVAVQLETSKVALLWRGWMLRLEQQGRVGGLGEGSSVVRQQQHKNREGELIGRSIYVWILVFQLQALQIGPIQGERIPLDEVTARTAAGWGVRTVARVIGEDNRGRQRRSSGGNAEESEEEEGQKRSFYPSMHSGYNVACLHGVPHQQKW